MAGVVVMALSYRPQSAKPETGEALMVKTPLPPSGG